MPEGRISTHLLLQDVQFRVTVGTVKTYLTGGLNGSRQPGGGVTFKIMRAAEEFINLKHTGGVFMLPIVGILKMMLFNKRNRNIGMKYDCRGLRDNTHHIKTSCLCWFISFFQVKTRGTVSMSVQFKCTVFLKGDWWQSARVETSEAAFKHFSSALFLIVLMLLFLMTGGEVFLYNLVETAFMLGIWLSGCRRG